MKRRAKHRGSMLIETAITLTLLGMFTGVLTYSTSQARRAQAALSKQRIAIRAADQVLWDLQRGQAFKDAVRHAKQTQANLSIDFKPLASDQSDDQPWVWVEVEADYDGKSASLIGRIPAQTLAGSKPRGDKP